VVSGRIHVIGNPPFGRQSSLCHKFIKHSANFADTISFILPVSFKKQSNMNKIPIAFHLINETILPLDSFISKGVAIEIPTVFQIWVKKNSNRVLKKMKEVPLGFSFVDQVKANVAISRVGSNAGRVKLAMQYDFDNLNVNTHFFLQVNNALLSHLKSIEQLRCTSMS
jgi:hypothetical protein